MLHYSTVGQKHTLTKSLGSGTMLGMPSTFCENETEEDLFLLVSVKQALFAVSEDPELADARAVLASLARQGFVITKKVPL